MALACTRFTSEPTLVKASSNAPPLRQGASGPGVKALQLALLDLGFAMPVSTGGGTRLPDGVFGPETAGAVRAFQQANALMVDAVVGTQTMTRLDQIIAAQTHTAAVADARTGNRATGLG